MKRLESLCNFLSGMFISSAASFFTLAVMSHNVKLVIPGIAMALICVMIVYNVVKAEKEEKKDNVDNKEEN